DCDGSVDEDSALDASTWYADTDSDGYGDAASTDIECYQPSGYVADNTDCDDGEATSNPSALEYCDGHDDDCDGSVDEESALDAITWYADNDSDGYGDATSTDVECYQPSGYVADNTDCNDSKAAVNPSASEFCDGIDNNCDGSTDGSDSLDAVLWYSDSDGDGYGDLTTSAYACSQPSGAVADGTDCDDASSAVNPAATERCDGIDNNCDGSTDGSDSIDASTWFADLDSDGFGDLSNTTKACSQPSSYTSDNSDCNDTTALAAPGLTEVCADGLDNDCDGTANSCDLNGDINLTSADGKHSGESAYDYSAYTVAGVGDINGDGLDDVVSGAWLEDAGGNAAGSTYLVLGSSASTASLASADGKFSGEVSQDRAGSAVAGAGDVNGDGYDDLLIGAYGQDLGSNGTSNAGAAYLLLGPVSGSKSLSDIADVKFEGETKDDQFGLHLNSAGDLDADGYDDMVVGAPYYNPASTGNGPGRAYIFYGDTSFSATIAALDADAILEGESNNDYAGISVTSAGDWDGDGFSDLLIGADGDDDGGANAGAAYVVLGPVSGSFSLASADVKLIGENSNDKAGFSLDDIGDMNSDGYGDIIVGAYQDDTVASNAGVAHLVFGGGTASTLDLSVSDVKLYGESKNDTAGYSVAGIGDIEGDGDPEVMVGAPNPDSKAGWAYLLYGPLDEDVDLGDARAKFIGETGNSFVGRALDGAGDVDGDGYRDILIASSGDDTGAKDAGAFHIMLGMSGL
ncbi:MAG: MopE-related protein, partial [Myxococcota bacterium]|nr:MopE-related protein [Myxococcota bacterium]